jgi:hypothetical protein
MLRLLMHPDRRQDSAASPKRTRQLGRHLPNRGVPVPRTQPYSTGVAGRLRTHSKSCAPCGR